MSSAIKLSILKPSVNNMSARVLVRAAGLECEELDMWGHKGTPEFLGKDPADLTPLLEEAGLPRGSLWESCAIMQYLCDKHGLSELYPTDLGERAMVNSAMFYTLVTIYPLIGRATYSALGFPSYPGEAFRAFFLDGTRFVGGDHVTIADIRFAASVEFLHVIDYPFPAWLEEYMSAVEAALGEAYAEPAADVRGYIEYVRSQAA